MKECGKYVRKFLQLENKEQKKKNPQTLEICWEKWRKW